MVLYTGATVEEAIQKGLNDLDIPRMKAHITVVAREKKGFLGLFGKKPAQSKRSKKKEKLSLKKSRPKSWNMTKKQIPFLKKKDMNISLKKLKNQRQKNQANLISQTLVSR